MNTLQLVAEEYRALAAQPVAAGDVLTFTIGYLMGAGMNQCAAAVILALVELFPHDQQADAVNTVLKLAKEPGDAR